MAAACTVSVNMLAEALGSISGPGRASHRTHSFAILPSRRNPRLLAPIGNTRAALPSLELYPPFQRRARALKSLLARLMAVGSNLWVCDRVDLAPGRLSDLESLVHEVTGEPQPVFALSLSAAAHVPKLTVQVMAPNGGILGYLKLPLTAEAAGRVRHEAAVLDQLRSFSQLRRDIPEPLFAGEWNGAYVLFQSAGIGDAGPTRFYGAHGQFLENLRRASAVERNGERLVDEIAAGWDRAAAALDPAWRPLGRNALRVASRQLRGASISCGISHGDFVPWNTRLCDSRLFVFDWESAEWDVPVCWDMFHFDAQVTSLLRRDSGIDLERLDAPAWNGLYLLYVLRSVARAVDNGADPAALAFRKQRLRELLDRQPERKTLEAMPAGGRHSQAI